MSNYDNSNRGSIWKNDRKETDSHPDFTGSLNVNGVEYWVSAWKRKPDASPNAPALSFSVKPKEQRGGGGHVPAQRVSEAPADFEDSDIPFVSCVELP